MLLTQRSRFSPSVWNEFFNRNDYPADLQDNEPRFSMPAVNVVENNDGYEIEVAAPGLRKEDFAIDLDKNLLTLSSEKEYQQDEENEGRFTRREFGYGKFKRSFSLPKTADGEKIKATYNDGILRISIPKKEEAKPKPPRQITVS